jgi:hypothetical protein
MDEWFGFRGPLIAPRQVRTPQLCNALTNVADSAHTQALPKRTQVRCRFAAGTAARQTLKAAAEVTPDSRNALFNFSSAAL